EVVQALAGIMDARFHADFIRAAVAAGKLPPGWQPPAGTRDNTPEGLQRRFAPWRKQGLFPPLPYGSDFTAEELQLARALQTLKSRSQTFGGRLRLVSDAMLHGSTTPQVQPYLERMNLTTVDS